MPARRRVRILHLYKDYFPRLGGVETHIRTLAEAQARAGDEVTVLVCQPRAGVPTRETAAGGVRIIHARQLATVLSMPLSLAQPSRFRAERPDLVHVHSPYPLGELTNWMLGRARATVITHHADVIRQRVSLALYGPLWRRVLRAADVVIATSPPYLATSPWLRDVQEKCVVVPLGVDAKRFAPPAREASVPRARPLRLLFLGRLRYYKGLDTLLHAMRELPEATLEVVGDGPMRATWEALARQLGLGGRVRFRGEVPDEALPGAYHEADAFVLPASSRGEAFGTVLLEAMASGLPCVTTEVGSATSWIVQDGVTGYVVAPCDPAALAERIRRLREPELRATMGKAGRARAGTDFSEAGMIAGVRAAYEKAFTRG